MFGRRLLPRPPDQNRTILQTLKDGIVVKYIELKKTFEGRIELAHKEVELESVTSTRIARSAEVVAVLSELILRINQKYSGRLITDCSSQVYQTLPRCMTQITYNL
jgi:hypothetical protein